MNGKENISMKPPRDLHSHEIRDQSTTEFDIQGLYVYALPDV